MWRQHRRLSHAVFGAHVVNKYGEQQAHFGRECVRRIARDPKNYAAILNRCVWLDVCAVLGADVPGC